MVLNLRWLKLLLASSFVLLIFPSFTSSAALAQSIVSAPADDSDLPDAPQPAQDSISPPTDNPSGSAQAGTASITGTVLDINRDVLQGARVTVTAQSGSVIRSAQSGNDGQFAFTGLPPDVYKLTVTAPGMSTFTSADIALQPGQARIVPAVTLAVSGGSTSVTVNGNKEQLAEQQLHVALQQRIGGVIPNFYSTYDWNAPPMLAKQKFQLSLRSIFDPVVVSHRGRACRRRAI